MKGENSRLYSLAAVLIWGPHLSTTCRRWAHFRSRNNNIIFKAFSQHSQYLRRFVTRKYGSSETDVYSTKLNNVNLE